MRRVLVTGFEPFGGETTNPSADAAALLPSQLDGASIITATLPVAYGQALPALEGLLAAHQPHLVLCLGQAGGRSAITPERVAINVDDAPIADNVGRQPIDVPVVEEGPAAYFSTLPIKAIVATIRAEQIPTAVSNTAGTFLCNHVFYGLMHLVATQYPGTQAGFIHIPYASAQVVDKPTIPSLTLEQIRDGLLATIRASLTHSQDITLSDGTSH